MAKKGFRHHRLLDVKELLLDLKSLALRKSEVKQKEHTEQLHEIQQRKKDHLKSNDKSAEEQDRSVSSRELQVQAWYTEQYINNITKFINLRILIHVSRPVHFHPHIKKTLVFLETAALKPCSYQQHCVVRILANGC